MAFFVYVANSGSDGISAFAMDPVRGSLQGIATARVGGNATALAVSPDRRTLYAAIRSQPYGIATLAVDSRAGDLDLLGTIPVPEPLAFITTDATGRFLLGASYHGNILTVNPVGPDGLVQSEPVAILRPGRNPHAILADASNRFVFAPCLGSDHICQFLFDEKNGDLTSNRPSLVAAPHESGPRHFRFSPDQRFIYVVTELSGEIFLYSLERDGSLVEKQRISYIPPGSDLKPGRYTPPINKRDPESEPGIWGADIHITPDGRFVYVSERTRNTISCLSSDPITGVLKYVGSYETEGRPRGFTICPKGRYLLVVGEKSHHIAVHAIDEKTGELKALGRYAAGQAPVWVEIVEFR